MKTFADPLGNTQSYDYDADGRLMDHTDATGAEEFFHYDIAGRQSVITHRRGDDRLHRYSSSSSAGWSRSWRGACYYGPNAFDDANLSATLTQLANAVAGTLVIRTPKPRWTKDPFPLKDTYRTAPAKPGLPIFGNSVSTVPPP